MTQERHTGNSSLEGQISEQTPLKERADPLFDVINICGKAGAGTSTLVKGLQKRLQDEGYDVEIIIKGRFLRDESIKTTGKDFTDYYHRATTKDVDIDTTTARTLMNPGNKGKIIIIDSRLSGWVAKKLTDAGTQMYAKTTNILLTTRADIRYERIFQRLSSEGAHLQYRSVVLETRNRDKGDQTQFVRTYPELAGVDVLSPRNRDEKGEHIYDKVINTTKIDKNTVVDIAEAVIKTKGLASQPRKVA